MSLSKEPTMKEWLESLRARQSEQMSTSNHLPSYDQLTTWLLDAQSENDRLQRQCRRLEEAGHENIKMFEGALAEKTQEMGRTIEMQRAHLTRDVEEREDLNNQIRSLKATIENMQKLRAADNEELQQRAREFAVKDDITCNLINQRDNLQTRYDAMVTEVEGLKTIISSRDEEILTRNVQIKSLKAELDASGRTVIVLRKNHEAGIADLRREMERLRNGWTECQGKLITANNSIETMGKQIAERIENSPEYNKILKDLSKLRKDHEELRAIEKSQREAYEYHKTVLRNVQATLAKRDAEVQNLRNVVEMKDNLLNNLKREWPSKAHDVQQNAIEELKAEVQNLRTIIETKDAALNTLREQRDEMAKTDHSLRKQREASHRSIDLLEAERDKLAGRVGALQKTNNELGHNYQMTMNRYNKLLERVKKMEMATKLKVQGLGDSPGEMKPMFALPADTVSEADLKQCENRIHRNPFLTPTELRLAKEAEPKRGDFVRSPIVPTLTRDQLTEWIEQLRQTVNMLQFNLEHQTNVRKAKEAELAKLRETVYLLQKATNGIEYEYMEPARSGKDFVTYFGFEARNPKDTPTGRRRIAF